MKQDEIDNIALSHNPQLIVDTIASQSATIAELRECIQSGLDDLSFGGAATTVLGRDIIKWRSSAIAILARTQQELK